MAEGEQEPQVETAPAGPESLVRTPAAIITALMLDRYDDSAGDNAGVLINGGAWDQVIVPNRAQAGMNPGQIQSTIYSPIRQFIDADNRGSPTAQEATAQRLAPVVAAALQDPQTRQNLQAALLENYADDPQTADLINKVFTVADRPLAMVKVVQNGDNAIEIQAPNAAETQRATVAAATPVPLVTAPAPGQTVEAAADPADAGADAGDDADPSTSDIAVGGAVTALTGYGAYKMLKNRRAKSAAAKAAKAETGAAAEAGAVPKKSLWERLRGVKEKPPTPVEPTLHATEAAAERGAARSVEEQAARNARAQALREGRASRVAAKAPTPTVGGNNINININNGTTPAVTAHPEPVLVGPDGKTPAREYQRSGSGPRQTHVEPHAEPHVAQTTTRAGKPLSREAQQHLAQQARQERAFQEAATVGKAEGTAAKVGTRGAAAETATVAGAAAKGGARTASATAEHATVAAAAAITKAEVQAVGRTAEKVAEVGAKGWFSALKVGVKGLGQLGKRIPLIGAAVTTGFVLWEAGGHAVKGEWGKAGAATLAGAAEVAGNVVGFGVGDAAREVVRQGVIHTAGRQYAPEKSGLRQLGELAYDAATGKHDPNAPGTVSTGTRVAGTAALATAASKGHGRLAVAALGVASALGIYDGANSDAGGPAGQAGHGPNGLSKTKGFSLAGGLMGAVPGILTLNPLLAVGGFAVGAAGAGMYGYNKDVKVAADAKKAAAAAPDGQGVGATPSSLAGYGGKTTAGARPGGTDPAAGTAAGADGGAAEPPSAMEKAMQALMKLLVGLLGALGVSKTTMASWGINVDELNAAAGGKVPPAAAIKDPKASAAPSGVDARLPVGAAAEGSLAETRALAGVLAKPGHTAQTAQLQSILTEHGLEAYGQGKAGPYIALRDLNERASRGDRGAAAQIPDRLHAMMEADPALKADLNQSLIPGLRTEYHTQLAQSNTAGAATVVASAGGTTTQTTRLTGQPTAVVVGHGATPTDMNMIRVPLSRFNGTSTTTQTGGVQATLYSGESTGHQGQIRVASADHSGTHVYTPGEWFSKTWDGMRRPPSATQINQMPPGMARDALTLAAIHDGRMATIDPNAGGGNNGFGQRYRNGLPSRTTFDAQQTSATNGGDSVVVAQLQSRRAQVVAADL